MEVSDVNCVENNRKEVNEVLFVVFFSYFWGEIDLRFQ